jgi:hypothetical protein
VSQQSEPVRVAAVVVGIEKYEFSDDRNLKGPGRHAVEFAEVLLDAGLLPDRIHLFLSLLEAVGAVDVVR